MPHSTSRRALTSGAALIALALATTPAAGQDAGARPAPRVEVELAVDAPVSGRLLLFAQPVQPTDAEAPSSVSADPFFHKDNFVAAREVRSLAGDARVGFDGDDQAYPAPMNQLPPGDYWVQAVLDADHDYAYRGGSDGGDIVSEVQRISLPSTGAAVLRLSRRKPEYPLWVTERGPMLSDADRAIVEQRVKPFEFISPALSAFQGRPVAMRGLVVTPEDYDAGTQTYPVVYFTHGFTAGMESLSDSAIGVLVGMHSGRLPPMIWVLLDQSGPFGTHEFADGPNNGPWGTALTQELIHDLEQRYRMDGAPNGRFLMGHSSGGWAMLWLQLTYPDMFGGAWISSPDITDFSRYEGVDILDPNARIHSEMGRMEAVLGEYGGQAASFEAVFSPRGPDGRPMALYDRATGRIDADVARHWSDHWDISRIIRRGDPQMRRAWADRLHVWVGANDEFGLDQSVRDLEAALSDVGVGAEITYAPGKGHFDLYADGSERQALRRVMAWRMWRLARPQSPLVDPGPLPPAPAR